MTNPHELKQLQVRLRKALNLADIAREEAKQAQRKENAARILAGELQKQIGEVEEKGITITEHALLRYFERVLGYDLGLIQQGLITPEVRAIAREMKNGKIPSLECRLVFKEGVVVTLEV